MNSQLKIYSLAFSLITLFACHSGTDNRKAAEKNVQEHKVIPDFNVALKFINDYAGFCSPENRHSSDTAWIEHNPLLTDGFKTIYKNIVDAARIEDPELGLDFDPIFDAQDFPDKGFSILKADTTSGYVTVRGNDWPTFELVLKVKLINNQWLVDGAGIINIPKEKRSKR